MSELTTPASLDTIKPESAKFQLDRVLTIIFAHFINDTYSAFLAPLLPSLIAKFSLSLTQAGTLSAVLQIPSLLNPIIGYLDDKLNLRFLVIFAPAVTATTMSLLGVAPGYQSLLVLLFITGISFAAFHAPSPAMVARASAAQVGKGMSLYMAAGELGRTVGPLLATWGLLTFSLDGMFPMAIPGWIASLTLFIRFNGITVHVEKQAGIREILPTATRLFLPLVAIVFFRSFLITGMGLYLPTLLSGEGAGIWTASLSLTIYQLAGVFGALMGGTMSDRLGRRTVLFVVSFLAPISVFLFLSSSSWIAIIVLILSGFLSLSAQPIMLAIVQDQLPNHRSSGNGIFMAVSFICLALSAVVIGMLGDKLGLHQALIWTAVIGLLAAPLVWVLPKQSKSQPIKSSSISTIDN